MDKKEIREGIPAADWYVYLTLFYMTSSINTPGGPLTWYNLSERVHLAPVNSAGDSRSRPELPVLSPCEVMTGNSSYTDGGNTRTTYWNVIISFVVG